VCTHWVRVIFLPEILNTRSFFGRCTALQCQQYTLQHTAFLLGNIHLDWMKCPSPAQANRSALYLQLPTVKFTQAFYLLNSCPSLQITLNQDPSDRHFNYIPPAHTVYIGLAGIEIIVGKEVLFFNLCKLQAHISRLLLLKYHKFEFVSYLKDDKYSA